MPTIVLANPQAADARSAAFWTAILGRSKHAQDVTEYLYARDGASIVVNNRDAHLDKLLREDRMTADEVAALVSLYPAWSNATAYVAGDIAGYSGTLYRCVQAHTSQADWTPDVVPALWTRTVPANVIPAWVQPTGAHDAYALGAQVTYNGQVWQSDYAANVWEPGVFGWTQVG